ncbi:MAG TPA: hypothetical protein VFU30_03845 [Gaiellaceae bacterium]|nr:hypothetical protein [Gaiellaceae bacterium]
MTPPQAREEARRILAERRFHGTSLPRPFHGFLDWLSRHLHFLARAWDSLQAAVGGADVLWGILGAIVVTLAVVAASRLAARRTRFEGLAAERGARRRGEDPAALERLADEAEQRGDLEIAVRLRFRAGLLRLARARALPGRPSLRTGEARTALHSARFDALARDFDEIVYGRRTPSADDVAAARSEWPRVLEEAKR